VTDIRIDGGASVHRAWGDGGTEFLACFQYELDAKEFSARKIDEDAARNWRDSFYIVSTHSDGKLTIIRHVKEPAKEAA
jgi:hypothetical protein